MGEPPSNPCRDLLAQGRQAWPDLHIEADRAAEALERILAAQGLSPAQASELDATEVWLAAACAANSSAAVAAFRQRYFNSVAPVVRQILGHGPDLVDEAWQVMGETLFVDQVAGAARVLQYAGTGRLQGLVRVSALRWALQRQRRARPEVALSDVLPLTASDPESKLIGAEHRQRFRDALAAAASALDSRQRNLLRLHHLRGVGVAELAKMYRVHRATMSRWLVAARGALGDAVLAHMNLGDSAAVGVLQSQIDLSLGRLLGSEP